MLLEYVLQIDAWLSSSVIMILQIAQLNVEQKV